MLTLGGPSAIAQASADAAVAALSKSTGEAGAVAAVDPPADGSAPVAGGAVKAVPVAKSYYEIISEDTVSTLSIHPLCQYTTHYQCTMIYQH